MTYYLTRSQAGRAGKRLGMAGFQTFHQSGFGWKLVEMSARSPAADWFEAEKPDFVAWVETHHIDGGRQPGYRGVLVVTCFKHELPKDIPAEFGIEPITPELWSTRSSTEKAEGRAKSEVASPTKLVWTIADSMPGASRKDVIAACVAQGINASTAGTQYYKWSKSKA